MPRVTATHIYRLLDYADGADTILASSDGVRPRPPALFGKHRFDWLMSLTGDRGAREMILKAHHVIAATNELFDVDTPEDLRSDEHTSGLQSLTRLSYAAFCLKN